METIVCAAQHIKAFFRQCTDGEMANWGEPCSDCRYVKECKLNWLARMKILFEKSDISIRLGRLGHSDKEDNHLNWDMHQ